jgi:L-asparaginase
MTVVVLSTGGTIMARADPDTGKLVPAVSAAELVEMMAWPDAPELEVEEFTSVPSWDLHGDLALRLARRAREHAERADVAGVVVPHGTDTMEENVYLADLLLGDGTAPVVFTGAQRAASEPDADGPANLRAAIRAATAAAARGRGATICFAGEIHAAREVRKVHTSALRAFASPGYGPIGHVDGDVVAFRRAPERRGPRADPETLETRVDLIRLYAGADARFVRAAVESGARAIVLEATGRGNANDAVVEAVRDAVAAGVAVVVCSRAAAGRVEPAYGRGGGADLAEAGALFAGDLAGPKARILLEVALGAGMDAADAVGLEAS